MPYPDRRPREKAGPILEHQATAQSRGVVNVSLQCCSYGKCDAVPEPAGQVSSLSLQTARWDPLDLTFRSRAAGIGNPGDWMPPATLTQKQREFRDRLEMPTLEMCVGLIPENVANAESAHRRLLEMYEDFALALHAGMFFTQITSSGVYDDVHCQLLDDLETLKLDHNDGCIIEFPLAAVTRVRHLMRYNDTWYSINSVLSSPLQLPAAAKHVVSVQFFSRQLAFVFGSVPDAQRFFAAMEMLIRHAQHGNTSEKKQKSAAPAAHSTSRPVNEVSPLHEDEDSLNDVELESSDALTVNV